MKKRWSKIQSLALAFAITATTIFSGPGLFSLKAQDTVTEQSSQVTVIPEEDMNALINGGTADGKVSVHDPSVIYDEESETYYIFGTHMSWAKSKDLVNWEKFENNINRDYETIFSEAFEWTKKGDPAYNPSGNLWAPDVVYNPEMGKYCMYMSVNGNAWNSVICLLTADSLDGDWTYVGPVVYSGFTEKGTLRDYTLTDYDEVTGKTELEQLLICDSWIPYYDNRTKECEATTWNTAYGPHAIDPCAVFDNGKMYLSYGSWSGGIYLLELDPATGLRTTTPTYGDSYVTVEYQLTIESDSYFGKKIAGGGAVSGEASYIEKIGDYFYLFISNGGLVANGGYQMRIFRSDAIDGDYVDITGQSAKDVFNGAGSTFGNIGFRLMSYYQWSWNKIGQVAQGHNSVYVDPVTNKKFVIYHTRTTDGTENHQVKVHELLETKDHWLVAAPFEYRTTDTVEGMAELEANELAGSYEIILQTDTDHSSKQCNLSRKITLLEDGTVQGEYPGTWSKTANENEIILNIGDATFTAMLVKQMIEGTNYPTIAFTGYAVENSDSNKELAIWGVKVTDEIKIAQAVQKLDIPKYVTSDITLPNHGLNDIEITWSSSNTDCITNEGKVYQNVVDATSILTAKLELNQVAYEKTFPVKVKAALYDDLTADTETISGAFYAERTSCYDVSDTRYFEIKVKGGDANWNNVLAVFTNCKPDGYKEYAVIRSDCWGWGGGNNLSVDGNPIQYSSDIVWEDFLGIMKDATILATVSKTATGVRLHYDVEGANGKSFSYTATTDVDTSEGLYIFFTCDTSEVQVTPLDTYEWEDTQVSTIQGPWWSQLTPSYQIKDKEFFEIKVNGGSSAWNNVVAAFTNGKTEGRKEYAVIRSDYYGWGGGNNLSIDGNPIEYDISLKDQNDNGSNLDELVEIMKDATILASVEKTETGLKMRYYVTGKNGEFFTYSAETEVNTAEGLYVFFICDNSTVSVKPLKAEKKNSITEIEGNWWTAWTPGYQVKDQRHFNIKVNGGDFNWSNIAAVFVNGQTDGTSLPHLQVDGYKEYVVIRTDSYGWSGDKQDMTCDGNPILYNTNLVMNDLVSVMKDASIYATIERTPTGIQLKYKIIGANGQCYTYVATADFNVEKDLYVFFVCDGSKVEVTEYADVDFSESFKAIPNITETVPMEDAFEGYTEDYISEFTIMNIGGTALEGLTISLDSENYFEIVENTTKTELLSGESVVVKVKAKAGLEPSELPYCAKLVVRGNGVQEVSYDLTFAVQKKYAIIELINKSPIQADLVEGYTVVPKAVYTIKNTGNKELTDVVITLSDGTNFAVTPSSVKSILPGESKDIEITGAIGLKKGEYATRITVAGKNTLADQSSVAADLKLSIAEKGKEIISVNDHFSDGTNGWWTAFSKNYFDLEDGYQLEIKMNVVAGTDIWNNWVFVLANQERDTEGYKESYVIRNDNWAWGTDASLNEKNEYDFSQSTIQGTDGSEINWDEYKALVQAGATVDFTIVRAKDVINFKAVTGDKYVMEFSWKVTDALTDTMKVFFTSEKADCTIINYSYEKSEKEVVTPPVINKPAEEEKEDSAPEKEEIVDKPVVEGEKVLVEQVEVNKKFSDGTNGWWESFSDYYTIQDKQMVEFTLATVAGTDIWNNWVLVFANGKRDADGYKESYVIRNDNWAWGADASLNSKNEYDFSQSTIKCLDGSEFSWDTYKALVQAGTNVKFTITRAKDVINVKAVTGNKYEMEFTWKVVEALAEDMVMFFTSEKAACTLVDYTKYNVASVSVPEVTPSAPSSGDDQESESEESQGEQLIEGNTVTIKSDAFWQAWTPSFSLSEDEAHFTVQVKGGSNAWNNMAFVFTNSNITGKIDPNNEVGESYKEYLVLRLDKWGWSKSGDNKTLSGADVVYEWDLKDENGDGSELDEMVAIMKDAKVDVTISRAESGVVVTCVITGANGKSFTYKVTADFDYSEGLNVFFITDDSEIAVESLDAKMYTGDATELPKEESTEEDSQEVQEDESTQEDSETEKQTSSDKEEETKSNVMPIVAGIILVLLLGAGIVFFAIYRKKSLK